MQYPYIVAIVWLFLHINEYTLNGIDMCISLNPCENEKKQKFTRMIHMQTYSSWAPKSIGTLKGSFRAIETRMTSWTNAANTSSHLTVGSYIREHKAYIITSTVARINLCMTHPLDKEGTLTHPHNYKIQGYKQLVHCLVFRCNSHNQGDTLCKIPDQIH